MELNLLMKLINSKIIKVEKFYVDGVFDFWDIDTDNCSIGIYNPVKFGLNHEQLVCLHEIDEKQLENHLIINVEDREGEYVMFELDNNERIYIFLRPEDFSSPEAMVLYFNTGEIVVVQEE